MAKVNSKNKLKAFIIGDGEMREELMEYCKEIDLSFTSRTDLHPKSDVFFTSWIQEADIAMAGIDIVALSSLNEGTPVSLIEAQAASKPIVSTQTGGIENVVIPNDTALLSPVGDVNTFAENLRKLANDRDLQKKLSLNGLNFVKDRFHFSALVKNMGSLYHKLLEASNVRAS